VELSEMRLMRAFLVLMSERGVSRAGQRLGLSQPATSHLLGRLRTLLQDPLLLRSGNAMVPTPRALEMERIARRLVADYEMLVRPEQPFESPSSAREFVITAPEYAERLLVPPLLRDWRHEAPNVRLAVRPPDPDRAPAMLESGELDLRIAWLTEPLRSLRSMPLFEDRLVCLVCARRRDIGATLAVADFLAMPHAIGYGHATTARILEEAIARKRHRRVPPFRVQNLQTLPHLVAGTDLIVILPQLLARDYAARQPIRIVDVPLPLPPIRYAAYWHERSQRDLGHRWLRAQFGRVARALSRAA
jgi:DNA-binding transcriptional LysR family regulator